MSNIKILTIVDMQNDFIEGGAMPINGASSIIPVINELIESGDYDLVITTQDWHPPNHISFAKTHNKNPLEKINVINEESGNEESIILWTRHCVARTFGAEIVESLIKKDDFVAVYKGVNADDEGNSGFTNIHKEAIDKARLHKETLTLNFVGIATDYSIFHTVKDTAQYVESIGAEYLISVNVLGYASVAINPDDVHDLFDAEPIINYKKIKI